MFQRLGMLQKHPQRYKWVSVFIAKDMVYTVCNGISYTVIVNDNACK